MILNVWAKKWNISIEAIRDLQRLLTCRTGPQTDDKRPESAVQACIRLEACRAGVRLWRNNVGAVLAEDGRMIRYGLANDSKELNRHIKSSDLIGIRPVLIGPEHVGGFIGQFVAREVKHAGWSYRGAAREKAQLSFLELVSGMGGDACFASGEGTI